MARSASVACNHEVGRGRRSAVILGSGAPPPYHRQHRDAPDAEGRVGSGLLPSNPMASNRGMSGANPLLTLTKIYKRYEPLEGSPPVEVLRGVSFTIKAGDAVGIVGPSGSGKTTLLNIIGTLDRPTSGEVKLDGLDLGGLTENELAVVRNRKIGFVFQSHHLLPQCTVLENVLVPTMAQNAAATGKEVIVRAQRLLDRVGLSARLGHRPGQLSGGERQRVAVVRALINSPQLLLADEPTGALDRAAAENLGGLLVELNAEEGVTLVVVTHSTGLASRMRVVHQLSDGQLVGA